MKENQYDQTEFFEKYRQFPRSVAGLQAAGEWHELRKLFPDFTDKRVLDIGCGFGWHCRYAAEEGARQVLGIDISKKMLTVAQEQTSFENVSYRQLAMEDMAFAPDSFDVVLSSLAFHYTPNFQEVCEQVFKSLSAKGSFVFSVEHPVFTAEGRQDWLYDEAGKPELWPVDHYFTEGKRQANFLGSQVTKYHRTLTTYLNTLLTVGFTLEAVVEPQPEPRLLAEVPGMADELRRPMMLLVKAVKAV